MPLANPDTAVPPLSEWISFGHSLNTGLGNTSAEFSWIARVCKTLNCDLETYGQVGCILALDDTSSASDGGYATVYKRLKSSLYRTAAPYIANFGAVSLFYGLNDIAYYDETNQTRDAFKSSMRACIGRARCAAMFEQDHASVTTSGASHSAAAVALNVDQCSGGTIRYISAADGSYLQLAVPADYPGNSAIWIAGAQTTSFNGVADIKVDGVSVATWTTSSAALVHPGLTASAIRVPITASGAHTVRITPTTVNTAFYFDWWGIEAEVPSLVIMPKQSKQASWAGWSSTFPPDDASVDTLNTWIGDLAAEFPDGRVVTPNFDAAINKTARYFAADNAHYNDLGSEVAAGEAIDALRRASLLATGRGMTATADKGSVVATRQMVKRSCRMATVSNISVTSAPATIDGVTPNPFDRVLVKNQTAPAENGIYVWLGAARPMERATDFDSIEEVVNGTQVWVEEGTVQNNRTMWAIANQGTIVLGTTGIRWTRTSPDVMLQPQRSYWTPSSNSIETIPGAMATDAVAALSSGRLTCVGGIVIPAGQTINTISWLSNSIAAGTPTQQLSGLYRASDRVRLAVSSNKTTTAWAANAVQSFTLTAAYTPDEDVPVYLGLMVVATTVPNLTCQLATSASVGIAPIKHGSSTTGLTTTLPDPAAALTAVGGVPYAYLA